MYFILVPAPQVWNAQAAAEEEVDLNVKLLVGMFETPHRPIKMERPRGWSESSINTTTRLNPAQRRSLAAKPPVPNDSFIPMAQLPRPAVVVKERKFYGKTHPLDRLTAGARQQKLAQPVFGTM